MLYFQLSKSRIFNSSTVPTTTHTLRMLDSSGGRPSKRERLESDSELDSEADDPLFWSRRPSRAESFPAGGTTLKRIPFSGPAASSSAMPVCNALLLLAKPDEAANRCAPNTSAAAPPPPEEEAPPALPALPAAAPAPAAALALAAVEAATEAATDEATDVAIDRATDAATTLVRCLCPSRQRQPLLRASTLLHQPRARCSYLRPGATPAFQAVVVAAAPKLR